MNPEFCVVVQGPSSYVDEISNAWSGYHVLFSTWKGEEDKYNVYQQTDDCVFCNKPSSPGVGNVKMQHMTTLAGLLEAKRRGFKQVIKWRSDMIPSNPHKFVNLFNKELTLFYWHDHDGGYIVDYFMGGNIDNLIKLWDFDPSQPGRFSEQYLVRSFFDKALDLSDHKYIGKSIDENNDVIWLKYNKTLAHYRDDAKYITNPNYV